MRADSIKKKVLVVDDDSDLVDVLTMALFELCGADTVPVGSYGELVQRGNDALGCQVALLDINLGSGQPSGIDVLRWLKEHRFGGRMMFLTGHASSHPLVAEAKRLGDITVVTKPISESELIAIVEGTYEPRAPG
jgi:DNA-binding NtrC family response regulator